MQRLGFIGTGVITAAMVRGLKDSALKDWPVILSPRSHGLSAELAGSLPGVTVAASNQDVVDRSDIVFLAVRPQDAEAVIRPLTFGAAQAIVSLVAALGIETVRDWTGVGDVTRAIPLTFVAQRKGVTPIMPPNRAAAEIFRALGDCIEVSDLDAFNGYAAASALMGTYFGITDVALAWLVSNGLETRDAELYLRNLFGSLSDVLRASPLPPGELRTAHSTRGGLNELSYDTFMSHGGGAALAEGLTRVMARLQNQGKPAS